MIEFTEFVGKETDLSNGTVIVLMIMFIAICCNLIGGDK